MDFKQQLEERARTVSIPALVNSDATHSTKNGRDFETWPGPPGVNCIWTSFNTSKTQSAASSSARGFMWISWYFLPWCFQRALPLHGLWKSHNCHRAKRVKTKKGPSEPSSSMKESTTQLRPKASVQFTKRLFFDIGCHLYVCGTIYLCIYKLYIYMIIYVYNCIYRI